MRSASSSATWRVHGRAAGKRTSESGSKSPSISAVPSRRRSASSPSHSASAAAAGELRAVLLGELEEHRAPGSSTSRRETRCLRCEVRALLGGGIDAAVQQVARVRGTDHARRDDQVVEHRVHDVVEQLVVALGARADPALRLPGHRDEHAERAQESEDVGQAAAVVEAVEVERDALLGGQRAHLLGQQADARLHPRALARGEREREQDVVAARERLPGVGVPGARDPRRAVRAQRVRALAQARVARAHDQLVAELALELRPQALGVARARCRTRGRSPSSSGAASSARRASRRRSSFSVTRPTCTSRSGLSSTPPSPTRIAAIGQVLAHVEDLELQRAVVGVADRAARERLADRVQQQVEGLLVERGERGQPRRVAGQPVQQLVDERAAAQLLLERQQLRLRAVGDRRGATRRRLPAAGPAQVALDGRERRVPPRLAG